MTGAEHPHLELSMSRYPDPNVSDHDQPVSSQPIEEEPHDPRPAMRSRTLLPPSPPNGLNANDLPPILEQNPDTTDDEDDDGDPRLPRDLEGGQGDSSFDPTGHTTNLNPWMSMQLYHNNIGLFRLLPDAEGPPRVMNYVPPVHFHFVADSTFTLPPEGTTRRSALHRTSAPSTASDPAAPNDAGGKAEEAGNLPAERPAGSNTSPQRRVHWSFDDYSDDEEDNEVRTIFYNGLRQQLGLVLPPQLNRTTVGNQTAAEADTSPPQPPRSDLATTPTTRDPSPGHPSEPQELQEVRTNSETRGQNGVGLVSSNSSLTPRVIDQK